MKNSLPLKEVAMELEPFCARILDKLTPEQQAMLDKENLKPDTKRKPYYKVKQEKWWEKP